LVRGHADRDRARRIVGRRARVDGRPRRASRRPARGRRRRTSRHDRRRWRRRPRARARQHRRPFRSGPRFLVPPLARPRAPERLRTATQGGPMATTSNHDRLSPREPHARESTLGRARLSFANEAEIDDFVATVERYEKGELTPDQWRAYRLVRGTYGQRQPGDVQMLRVKIPQGDLGVPQLHALADVGDEWSRGFGHLTTRQTAPFRCLTL